MCLPFLYAHAPIEKEYAYVMLGVTHQMIALLAALWLLTLYPVNVGIAVGILAVMAVMIGALTPDLDHPAANIWRRMLGGRAIGHIFDTFSGGHRHFTHSFIGIIVIGFLTHRGITTFLNPQYFDTAFLIWRAYMIGYISHPIADTFTDRGVPWFWPLRFNIKIPPGPEQVRVTTDSLVERLLLRAAIVVTVVMLLRTHWSTLLNLFR